MRLVGSWHLPRRSSANSRQGTQQLSSNGAPSSVVPADDGIPVGRLGLYVLTGHVFGKGANGRVYQGRHSITGQEVALKQLTDGVAASRAGGGRRSGADVAPPREVLAMRHLPPHPNIAQLVEHVCVNGQHYIVMEPCYGGELFAQVEASGSLPEEYVLRLTRGAASAVSHMHSHGVAHRDLKLENMLVSEQGGECVKICDFGLAHVHALGPPPRRGDDLLGVCQSAELLVRVCGTKSYAAPEVLASVPYDGFRADIWSLGVCIFGMVAGFFPLEVARKVDWRFNSLYEAQKAGASSVSTIYGFYSRDCPFSPSLIELLDQMLQIAPSRRPSIFQVVASPWMHDPAAGHATPVAAAAAAAAAAAVATTDAARQVEAAVAAVARPLADAPVASAPSPHEAPEPQPWLPRLPTHRTRNSERSTDNCGGGSNRSPCSIGFASCSTDGTHASVGIPSQPGSDHADCVTGGGGWGDRRANDADDDAGGHSDDGDGRDVGCITQGADSCGGKSDATFSTEEAMEVDGPSSESSTPPQPDQPMPLCPAGAVAMRVLSGGEPDRKRPHYRGAYKRGCRLAISAGAAIASAAGAIAAAPTAAPLHATPPPHKAAAAAEHIVLDVGDCSRVLQPAMKQPAMNRLLARAVTITMQPGSF